MEYQLPKGTHDMIGTQARLFEEVSALMKQIATIYGYQPIHTPIFEHTELFLRSVGESSDIVRKEMYTFMDKGKRSLTLRPEMTAGALRAIVSEKLDKTSDLPIKLFYLGPAFRYERPQLGRFRQFHQFGIESVGVTSYFNDVETIMLGAHILQALGFKNLVVKVNSLGDSTSRDNYRRALKEYFTPLIDTMCPDCNERLAINPLRILDCKVPHDQELAKGAPKMDQHRSSEAHQYLSEVLTRLSDYHIPFEVDSQLVRGLDYYSHVVFEYHLSDEVGKTYGALGAGGHYDKLLEELNGSPLAGVGLAFGLERIVTLIDKLDISPDFSHLVDVYVLPLGEQQLPYAFATATLLRNAGLSTDITYETKSIKQLLKRATRAGAKYAVIVGEDERKREVVTVKNLDEETQEEVKFNNLINYFQSLYGHHHHHNHDEGCDCDDGSCTCEGKECECNEDGCQCKEHK
ncbi:MAG TPA: histidine--tRNA ligase [Firmicutes bacterium]|nr:histidine--tRNA ligase [Bacillota bacterium]